MGAPGRNRVRGDVARRPCLRCGKPFRSLHKWNRICKACALINSRAVVGALSETTPA